MSGLPRWFWPVSVWVMFVLVLLGGVLRPSSRGNHAAKGKITRVGIVLSVGGLGDQSFNDSAYAGLMQAKRLFRNLEVRHTAPRENAAAKHDLENFAKKGFDLIIGVGFMMARAVKDIAKKYPKQKFAIVDSVIQLPNTASLVFQEHEGSYLAGVLAALSTKTGTVGFMGAMDIPLIRKFGAGFKQGVHDTRPAVKVQIKYLGASFKSFHDPAGGKSMAQTMFGQNADIIFHAAGSSGKGAINAARSWNNKVKSVDKKRYIIGVDGNQDGIAKGSVLTSMLKRVDVAVFETIKNYLAGRFQARTFRFGVKEGGVGVTQCKYSRDRLPKDFKVRLAKVKKKIISGTISVPSDFPQVRLPKPRTPAPQKPAAPRKDTK